MSLEKQRIFPFIQIVSISEVAKTKKHFQIFEETTGTSYIEKKFMEKKNSLIRSQYKQIVVHLSKEDKKNMK